MCFLFNVEPTLFFLFQKLIHRCRKCRLWAFISLNPTCLQPAPCFILRTCCQATSLRSLLQLCSTNVNRVNGYFHSVSVWAPSVFSFHVKREEKMQPGGRNQGNVVLEEWDVLYVTTSLQFHKLNNQTPPAPTEPSPFRVTAVISLCSCSLLLLIRHQEETVHMSGTISSSRLIHKMIF